MISKLIRLINLCLEKNIPFVSYRLPGGKSVHTWVQTSGRMLFAENIRDVIDKHGFVYAPFHRRTNFPVVLFEPELIFKNFDIPEPLLGKLSGQTPQYQKTDIPDPIQLLKHEYLQQASIFIKAFRSDLNKVIQSRVHLEMKKSGFDAGRFFIKMQEKYPEAFCHIIHIPGAGTWAGASPETLLRIDEKRVRTVSMAGTQLKKGDSKEIRWHEKEMEEQRLVTDYIIQVLNHFKIRDYVIDGPQTIEAGSALHISTKFTFDRIHIQNQLGDFLDHLHPTPAVCGTPKEKALEMIFKNELHNREYYSGFCGPINMKDKTDLFVNIRCMKILENKIALYVGGGLTAKSDPEKEWEETELKAQTLLSVIENY